MLPVISVSHNLRQLADRAKSIAADQLPFATALALTTTAREAADEVTRRMPRYLDRPTPFTMRAWRVARATKRDLTATVYAMDAQAAYLRWQVAGGDRAPARVALKLPVDIKLDQFGNIPRADLKRLIALAQQGKKLTRVRGAKLGISSKVDLFYGDPGHGLPVGIYKRVGNDGAHHLVPLVVFPRPAAHYKARLPLREIVSDVVRARFASNFGAAMAQARRTAR